MPTAMQKNGASVSTTCLHGKTALHYAATAYETIYELHKTSSQFAFLQRRLRKNKLYFSRVTVFFGSNRGEQEAHAIGHLLIKNYHQYFDDLGFQYCKFIGTSNDW